MILTSLPLYSMKSVYVTVKAQVFFDPDDVQALIADAAANGEKLTEQDAIQSLCTRKFDPVNATIRDVLPDFSSLK